MKKGFTSVLALVSLLASGAAVQAGSACGARDVVTQQLQSKYNESHRASGLESDTKMVEIWAAEDNSTWTILITRASGETCVVAAGRNWLDIPMSEMKLGQAF